MAVRRVVGAVAVVAAVGVGAATAGFFAGRPQAPSVTQVGTAGPLAVDPGQIAPPSAAPDPSDPPPLATELSMRPIIRGNAPYRYRWEVPEGWVEYRLATAEWRWISGPIGSTQFVRVEVVESQRQTIASILDDRIAQLRLATGISAFTILRRDVKQGVLSYSYISGTTGLRRYNTLRWRNVTGGDSAQIEISVEGRAVDGPGLDALHERVSASVQRAG